MRHAPTLALLLLAAACAEQGAPLSPSLDAPAVRSAQGTVAVGGVFTTTNGAEGNAVVAFARAADGSLSYTGTYSTGGRGIGGTANPLGSQFALVLSENARHLFVVNAGSDEVSAFDVRRDGLALIDVEPSLGARPTSVAVSKGVLYVLNAGSNTITLFDVAPDGSLAARSDDTRALGAATSGPGAIRVSPDGTLLAVTGRTSNTIDTYAVHADGSLGEVVTSAASGTVPFGFDFTPNGILVTSDAGTGSASSYAARPEGGVRVVSGAVSTEGQRAACWLIVGQGGRFAYVANAGSASISAFSVAANGELALLTPGGVTADLGAGAQPLDLDVSRDGRFLYVFENGTGTIGGFAVNGDGTLAPMPDTPGLAARGGYQGLAAY
jgi:6-phosphogluconolactonase (cycloisomerase 2 family)